MVSSKYVVSGSKKSRFMKEQEGSGLLIGLGIKASLSIFPLLGNTMVILSP